MLSIMVATMLSMAAKDPLAVPRKAYFNCLIDLHNEAVKKKSTVEEFTADATAGCETDRKAFSDAVFKAERPSMKEAEAKERADEEVTWVIEAIVDSFTSNREDGSTMGKQ